MIDETVEVDTPTEGEESAEPTGEPPRWVRIMATLVVVTPIVIAAVRAVRNDWFPIGDNALLFIRTADVWTDDHPYLGSWTSASLSVGENMNNPGAFYDWLIAPFAHILSPGPAAAIGVATVNTSMMVGLSAASHRIGGWLFQRWALLFGAVIAWSMGSEMLIDIWQANALILPFVLFLVLAIGVANGDDGLLPWSVVVASLLVQTHISYAYIFVFVIAGVVAARAWLRPSSEWKRPAAISVGVLALLSAPSIYEQFFGPGKGNMSRLLGNASGGDTSLGLADATRIIGSIGSLPPWWGRSGYTETVPITRVNADGSPGDIAGLAPLWLTGLGLLTLLVLLVAVIVLSHRRGLRLQTAAGVVAAIVLAGSVLALSRLTIGRVGLSPHHVRWVWPMMVVIHLTLVWSAISLYRDVRPDRHADRRHSILIMGIVAITSVLNFDYLAQPSGPVADYAAMPTMRQIEPAIIELEQYEPLLYDVSNVIVFEPYSSTMMMWMQERGIEFRVEDEGMIRQLGEARRADGTESVRLFQLQGTDARVYEGSACVIGIASQLDPGRAAEIEAMVETRSIELAIGENDIITRQPGTERAISDADRADFDLWADTAYALLAEGAVC